MTDEKLLELIALYRAAFERACIQKVRHASDRSPSNSWTVLNHCHAMLDDMERFLQEGRRDKVFRWLGFIQGCLWATKFYSLEELKNHSRP